MSPSRPDPVEPVDQAKGSDSAEVEIQCPFHTDCDYTEFEPGKFRHVHRD